jgi:hypothetical protein
MGSCFASLPFSLKIFKGNLKCNLAQLSLLPRTLEYCNAEVKMEEEKKSEEEDPSTTTNNGKSHDGIKVKRWTIKEALNGMPRQLDLGFDSLEDKGPEGMILKHQSRTLFSWIKKAGLF